MASKRTGKRAPTGRFVICPCSAISHDLVAVEVYKGKSGEHFFFLCGECMSRCFLNTWEEGWGWSFAQVMSPGPWGPVPPRIVGLSPARRIELEMAAGFHRR